MSKIITKDVLRKMSNEELLERTKDHALTFHMYNNTTTDLCVNDFLGVDVTGSFYFTHTDIKIELKYVDYLEIL